jgi:osmotically-inducible protein OsmY
VKCEFACLEESAAAKQQTAELARPVNGVTDVINSLHMQVES